MMRESGHTKRFHTIQTLGNQTVAEHSFHVAMLAIELTEGKASANLLKACLYHDLPEVSTGDVPGHVKWANPELTNILELMEHKFSIENGLLVDLTADEAITLKLADAFELGFYCTDQLMLGNRGMREIYHRIVHHITKMAGIVNNTTMWRPHLNIMERLGERYHDATI